jgi:hypothetical protein
MPIPVIVVVGGLLVSAVLGGAVVSNWDSIMNKIKGKKIAVLGARAVGKSHLVQYLTAGDIPDEYAQTTAPNKTNKVKISMKDLNLYIKEGLDVSGSVDAYPIWKKLCSDVDIVFYLVRVDWLKDKDSNGRPSGYEGRVEGDISHICDWLRDRGNSVSIYIIGTHCDKDVDFISVTDRNMGDYEDSINKMDFIKKLKLKLGGGSKVTIVLGSMKDEKGTKKIVAEILKSEVQ